MSSNTVKVVGPTPTPPTGGSPFSGIGPRNLGTDPNDGSSTDSPSPTSTNTYSDLFPTASSSSSSDGSKSSPNVYYLVFLGVLVVLLGMAACLGYRAFRIRRRFRTATQRAIARGDPLPDVRDEYWGLGGLSAWTTDGFDRWNSRGLEEAAAAARGERKKNRWRRIPELHEAVAEGEKDTEGEWDFQPLVLHSLSPPSGEKGLDDDAEPDEPPQHDFQVWHTGPRPRPAPMFPNRRRSTSAEPASRPAASSGAVSSGRGTNRELDREIQPGEPLRVGVMISMPHQGTISFEGDADDAIGWEPGMEMGIWEGEVSGRKTLL